MKLSAGEKEKLRELVLAGRSYRKIAAELGTTFQNVQSYARRMGIARRRRRQERTVVRAFVEEHGLEVAEMAQKLGYDQRTVLNYIQGRTPVGSRFLGRWVLHYGKEYPDWIERIRAAAEKSLAMGVED